MIQPIRRAPNGRRLVRGLAWTGLEVLLAMLLILGLLPAIARAAG